LLINLSSGFRSEFDTTKVLGKQLNDKFRGERNKIEDFMVFKKEDDLEYTPILYILEEKEKNIKNLVNEILNHKNENSLLVDINNLIQSYIHMLMNRLFKSKNRMHEMVCYDFLCRYYKSIVAKEKNDK